MGAPCSSTPRPISASRPSANAFSKIDAVLYTHGHADHILGLDDVRPLSFPRITGGGKIPLFASDTTAQVLRSVFRYIFEADYKYGGLAQVEILPLDGPLDLFGATFTPLAVHAWRRSDRTAIASARLRISPISAAYPKSRWHSCRALTSCFLTRCGIIHILRTRRWRTRSKLVERLKPKRAYFTHIAHDLPHEETNATLPANVRLAHDGLRLEFDL